MQTVVRTVVFLLAVGVLSARSTEAAFIDAPLPSNTYITENGFDWAWVSPLPSTGAGFDLAFQTQFGWRIPTAQELLSAPLATDFLFAGGNVPFNGVDAISGAFFSATNAGYIGAQSAGACATPYFSTVFRHCDWQDGLGQTFGPWAGMDGAFGFADQLVIRESSVPEPASMLLFGTALVGAGVRRRRKNRA